MGSVIRPGWLGGGCELRPLDGGGRSGSVLRGRGMLGAECDVGASGFSVVEEVRYVISCRHLRATQASAPALDNYIQGFQVTHCLR